MPCGGCDKDKGLDVDTTLLTDEISRYGEKVRELTRKIVELLEFSTDLAEGEDIAFMDELLSYTSKLTDVYNDVLGIYEELECSEVSIESGMYGNCVALESIMADILETALMVESVLGRSIL